MPKVLIPSALRPFTNGQSEVQINGATVGEVLSRFAEQFPQARRHLYDDKGQLRNFVNIFLGDNDVRALKKDATPVSNADVISIVPAVAGGSEGRNNNPFLSNEEIMRYSRHLILPEVGMEGQKKLKAASVLIIGGVSADALAPARLPGFILFVLWMTAMGIAMLRARSAA